jgi:hypothetical protein
MAGACPPPYQTFDFLNGPFIKALHVLITEIDCDIFYISVPAAKGRDWLDGENINLQLSVSSSLLVLGQHTILVLLCGQGLG